MTSPIASNPARATAYRTAGWALLIAPAIAGAAIAMWAMARGPGTNMDSQAYLCGAQSLAERGTLSICGRDFPLVWFPPLYPTMLAGLDLVGVAGFDGARLLSAACFACSILLAGALLYAATSSFLVSLAGELMFLAMVDILTIYLYAMSEPPFIVFLLLFFFWLWYALEDDRLRWVVLAAGAAAAGALTRYMGYSIVLTGAIVLAWYDDRPRPIRLRRTVIFIVVACTPSVVWSLRNHYHGGSMTARSLGWYLPLQGYQYSSACFTVVRWFFPWLSFDRCMIAGLPVMIAIFLGLALVLRRNPGKLACVLAAFALCNGAFIMASRVFVDPYIWLAGRMFVPIQISVLILTLWLVHAFVTRPRANAPWRWVAIPVAALLLFTYAANSIDVLKESHNEGLEMTRRYYHDSALIAWLRHVPPETVIFSDEPEPIYFFNGRPAEALPITTDPVTKLPLQSSKWDLERMHDRLGTGTGLLVYFYEGTGWRKDNMPKLDAMPAAYHLLMSPVMSNKDGIIYEVRNAAS